MLGEGWMGSRGEACARQKLKPQPELGFRLGPKVFRCVSGVSLG